MKKRLLLLVLLLSILAAFTGCFKREKGSFGILFIDVGKGDSALVECDGRYMLIDGGDSSAGDIVYNALLERKINHLDILAISHLHQDHIGGLSKALTYASEIDLTISNSDESDLKSFKKLKEQLDINGSQITIPIEGTHYKLGSADVEVLDVSSKANNDSLVLLITYGKTRFLFTGDIEEDAQRRLQSKYENDKNKPFKVDLIKMPHHGSKILIRFLEIFTPDYAVISSGKNIYGHPSVETLDRLAQANVTLYRTDKNGDVFVKSDGKKLFIQTKQ